LRQYLTIAPYGNRTHGIVRAATLYFDKPIEDLSWLQAAYLAALPQQPSRMSPWTKDGHARAMARARRILNQLHERGVIGDEDLHVALTSDLALVTAPASAGRVDARRARVEPSSSERRLGRSSPRRSISICSVRRTRR
jgi:penicillin-binding protein 1C